MDISDSPKRGVDSFTIKMIAIAAMLIDHIAWRFVPTVSLLGMVMHCIGRITAPVMCFFIVQGYLHTHSVKRYALRLAVFALIAHVPFTFFETGGVSLFPCSVIYTLLLGLLAVWAVDKLKPVFLKVLAVLALCVLSLPGDWMFMGVLMCVFFYLGRDSRKARYAVLYGTAAFSVLFGATLMHVNGGAPWGPAILLYLFQAGIVLAAPLLDLYNGQRGGPAWGGKIFYWFYPAHLLLLGLIAHL